MKRPNTTLKRRALLIAIFPINLIYGVVMGAIAGAADALQFQRDAWKYSHKDGDQW